MNTRSEIKGQLPRYASALQDELEHILNYWQHTVIDMEYGGFRGEITNDNVVVPMADKGAVLNARILWAFSAAYRLNGRQDDLLMANRAYEYIVQYFIDHEYGGVFWMVDYTGQVTNSKKQIYALAFTIYALSEYFMATANEKAKTYAILLFRQLAAHSFDPVYGGYFEAFGRQWEPLSDLRLSMKDANEKKTMNTHLHVLEAFTNLYRIWPDDELEDRIIGLLGLFNKHIIDHQNGHLKLFFDEEWNPKSSDISFGHDIEASWLLLEAAETIAAPHWIGLAKDIAIKMAHACKEGLDTDGGLWYEKDTAQPHIIKEKHWWVQAESMVGFFNAWQLSGDAELLAIAMKNWDYVRQNLVDNVNGEWFWGRDAQGQLMPEDKAGVWKCPYHNSRACIEIISRIGARGSAYSGY